MRNRWSVAGVVAGVLALGLVVPALASASPEWYLGGTPITSNTAISWTGSLELEVSSGLGLTVRAKCEDSGSGLAKTHGAGEEKAWTFTCTNLAECPSPSLEAKALPWTTQLFSSEGKIFQEIGEGGLEAKSIRLTCKSTEKRTVECTIEDSRGKGGLVTQMTNQAGGTVRAASLSDPLKCSGLNGLSNNTGAILTTQTIKESLGRNPLQVK